MLDQATIKSHNLVIHNPLKGLLLFHHRNVWMVNNYQNQNVWQGDSFEEAMVCLIGGVK